MHKQRPTIPIKGRGAVSQVEHRFTVWSRQDEDDGWTLPEASVGDGDAGVGEADAEPPRLKTHVTLEDAKSVITRNQSPDLPFEQSLNPYRGCEHGCIYCFARPTHAYLGYSPGLDFETQLIAKRNVAQVLARELASPRYRPQPLVIGTATDCYQPIERDLRLTRQVIEVLSACQHPFGLVTKSSAVERDLDLIAPMAHQQRAAVYITVTTLDGDLARRLEPRAASPQRRLRTIRTLTEAGVRVGVSLAPQIPFLNDDMEQVLEAAREAGATSAFYMVLRLPWEVAPLFKEWLHAHYPDRADRVMARIHDMRGGKDYDAHFSRRMGGTGLWAQLLAQRFAKATTRLGYHGGRGGYDMSGFVPPLSSLPLREKENPCGLGRQGELGFF